jgi:oxygen tolerance protein BatD
VTGRRALAVLAGLALLAAPAAAQAALAVSAKVDREEVARDEVLVLELRVEADAEPSVALPTRDFEFDVVSRSQSTQTSVDLGGGGGVRIRRTLVYQLGLSPRREGTLTIPPIQVKAGPASAETVPLTVKVLPAGSRTAPAPPAQPRGGPFGGSPFGGLLGPPGGGAGGSRAWHGWERDLVLQPELDRKELFLGEQLTAAVVLLSPVKVVTYDGYQPPLYDGFWSEQLETPQQLEFQQRKVNGLPLLAYTVQRLALFPTRAGELELGSFQLSAVIRVGADDPFDPFPDVRRAARRSEPVKITVKPLPAGAPGGFDSVNVGTMSLSATLSEKTAAVGQPVTLRLTAQGEGNVKAWTLPTAPAVAGLRPFAPTSSDKVAPKGARLAGSRTVETVLVPDREGTFTLPPIRWPTFDPRSGAYRVLETPALALEVRSAAPAAPVAAAAPGQNALGGGLRPLRSAGAIGRRGAPPWQGWPFWALLGAPVALFAVLTGVDRLREAHAADGGARRLRLAGRVARRRLATASRLAGGAEAGPFFAEVERALTGYCADKLGRPAAGLTRDELARALAEAGAHPPALRALAQALDACDAGRYGGATVREEVLALAGRAMELLEEAHWHGAGGGA